MKILPTGTVGAEVQGVDLASLSAALIEAIKQAWYRHDVLVFRGQKLTDDDLLVFSRHFGELDPPPRACRSSTTALTTPAATCAKGLRRRMIRARR